MRFSHVLVGLCAFAIGIVGALTIVLASGAAAPREQSLEQELTTARAEASAIREQADDGEAAEGSRDRLIESLNRRVADAELRAEEKLARVQASLGAAADKIGLPQITLVDSYLRRFDGVGGLEILRLPSSSKSDDRDFTGYRIIVGGDRRGELEIESIGDRMIGLYFIALSDDVTSDDAADAWARLVLAPWLNDLPPDWTKTATRTTSQDAYSHDQHWFLGSHILLQLWRAGGTLQFFVFPSPKGMLDQVRP